MIKRILFIIVYIICLLVGFLGVFATLLIIPIAIIRYIINGKDQMDFVVYPVIWATNLPFKIMNDE